MTRAQGMLDFDDATQSWVFKAEVRQGDTNQRFDRVFGILPSMALDDMINHVDKEGAQNRFELTARVLIYQGRNFLLPSLVTPLSAPLAEKPAPPQPESPESEEEQTSANAPVNSLNQDGDAAAARLEERLRQRIKALPQSSDSIGDDAATAKRTLQEGTRLQNRRSAIVRDQRSGTFRVVFDAQGPNTVDPTMELLPCLLLAELERLAAESELPPAVYMSGEVTSFRGRNYLLPTIWRPARQSRNIFP